MSLLSRLAVQAARAYGILSSADKTKVPASYLVVAGGGGGGTNAGAGGGAGGYLTSTTTLSTLNTYSITVGAGGATSTSLAGTNGNNSVVSGTGLTTVTSTGGGGGGTNSGNGVAGGSGGGGGGVASTTGGAGTAGQGNAGGNGLTGSAGNRPTGGGGGAGAVGANGVASNSGNGGAGTASSISGSSVTYAGGGGGSMGSSGTTAGTGGLGGGGNGQYNLSGQTAGTANTGGGGGGGSSSAASNAGAGGSGIVIISYTSATPKFVGGTLTTSGGNQIHTFTSSGTLSPITPVTASYLVVAGGGGGAQGGGGAGGYQTSSTTLYSGATYVVTVGAGGAYGDGGGTSNGSQGGNSVLSGTGLTTITSVGGGYGQTNSTSGTGGNGGSGGGGARLQAGGTGTSGQGNNGGTANAISNNAGGGGGGAGAVGGNASNNTGGNGGIGSSSSISGTSTYYAGGGGGGCSSTAGTGGTGGGGNGGSTTNGSSGTPNTGGGGGGTQNSTTYYGGSGGSGTVIISYAGSQVFNGGLVTSSGGNTIHTFTSTGALTPLTNNLNNSLRFRSSASAYLNRTPASATNRTTWTWSGWVKLGLIASNPDFLFSCYVDANNMLNIQIENTGQVQIYGATSGSTALNIESTQVLRDPSAWYHLVLAVDTTQATAANRIKMYVNGSQVTSLTQNTYPSQNYNTFINSTNSHRIGSIPSYFYDGYMTDINFIDGQALEPYYFGNNDANGVWKPILYKGTYGTNGFYLPFSSFLTGGSLSSATVNGFSTYAYNEAGADYIKTASTSVFNVGTGNFTSEVWVKFNTVDTWDMVLSYNSSNVNQQNMLYYYLPTNEISYYDQNTGTNLTITWVPTAGTWYYLAMVRSSGVLRLYINGVVQASTVAYTANISTISYLQLASQTSRASAPGQLSNYRFNNTAVYTSNFTPPTSPSTAISGTQLLTFQNSTLIDNSSNALTLTNTASGTPIAVVDSSPNGNNWTTNNISLTAGTTYDAMLDVPTNTSATVANYATLNPVNNLSAATISSANLNITSSANWKALFATIGATTGKFYCELTDITTGGGFFFGVATASNISQGKFTDNNYIGKFADDYGLRINDYGSGSSNNEGYSTNASFTTLGTTQPAGGTVYGLAVDLDNRKIYWSRNNTWYNSANPSSGTNGITITSSVEYFIGASPQNPEVVAINFGQRPFSYSVPSGFTALNTFNLPTPTILQGNKYMDATLYTGNGSGLTVVNAGQFKSDLVWIKNRSATGYENVLDDSVRGAGKGLFSNSTGAENASMGGFLSFNSNGWSMNGTIPDINLSGDNFVGWQWQAGQGSTSSNTAGSITSTVSVSTTAGFSIVTYTGNGTAGATVGHGLGVTPAMIIVKARSAGGANYEWVVQHKSVPASQILLLSNTIAATTSATFNSQYPSSSVIYLGSNTGANQSTITYVGYCWAEIAGFSAFGSYTGNGSTDGPFVYTGFRPKYVLVKLSSGAGENWYILDSARNTYNPENNWLTTNTSDAENGGGSPVVFFDFLSNGFKIRNTGTFVNTNAATYIYAAFAENPFKNANAR